MSTKRSPPVNWRDAATSAKREKTTDASSLDSSAMSLDHLPFVHALRFGVLEFLATSDAAMLLSCCTALRNDSELAKSALLMTAAGKNASHFFRKCGKDWFNLDPTRIPLGYEKEALECNHGDGAICGDHDDEKSVANDHASQCVGPTKRPAANAQLVSLIATFEKLILPARPDHNHFVHSDNVFAMPVAISLWEYHPDKHQLQPDHDWTREDIRLALNVIHEGFGDRFTEEDPAKAHPSEFGAHWENIQMTEDGGVECTLCGKGNYIIQRYAAVNMQRSGDRSALDALSASPAGHRYAFCDTIVDSVAALYDGSGDPHRMILDSKEVVALPFPDAPRWDEINLSCTVGELYGFSELCAVYAQPLKRSLLKSFKFANRIKYPWVRGAEYWFDKKMDVIQVELLAGVSSSGYLCGSFYVRDDWGS